MPGHDRALGLTRLRQSSQPRTDQHRQHGVPGPLLLVEQLRRVLAAIVAVLAVVHRTRLHRLLDVPAELGRAQRLGLDGQAVAPAAVADVLQRHRQVGRVQDEDVVGGATVVVIHHHHDRVLASGPPEHPDQHRHGPLGVVEPRKCTGAQRLLQLPDPARRGDAAFGQPAGGRHRGLRHLLGTAAGRGTDRGQHHQGRVVTARLDRRDEGMGESGHRVLTAGQRQRHEQRASQLRLQRILAAGQIGGTVHQLSEHPLGIQLPA